MNFQLTHVHPHDSFPSLPKKNDHNLFFSDPKKNPTNPSTGHVQTVRRLQEGRLLVRSSGASFAALFPHLDALIGQAGNFATNKSGGVGVPVTFYGNCWKMLLGFFLGDLFLDEDLKLGNFEGYYIVVFCHFLQKKWIGVLIFLLRRLSGNLRKMGFIRTLETVFTKSKNPGSQRSQSRHEIVTWFGFLFFASPPRWKEWLFSGKFNELPGFSQKSWFSVKPP